ncbi:hypothetical protein QP028_03560 [Corynebacterium suedekumii]|nr:hypothetical protein QP028_03560 [Corynebacterium suedekumii]
MTVTPERPDFRTWLAARSDAELSELLRLRPDVVLPLPRGSPRWRPVSSCGPRSAAPCAPSPHWNWPPSRPPRSWERNWNRSPPPTSSTRPSPAPVNPAPSRSRLPLNAWPPWR